MARHTLKIHPALPTPQRPGAAGWYSARLLRGPALRQLERAANALGKRLVLGFEGQ
jgi:hypothetical protein